MLKEITFNDFESMQRFFAMPRIVHQIRVGTAGEMMVLVTIHPVDEPQSGNVLVSVAGSVEGSRFRLRVGK